LVRRKFASTALEKARKFTESKKLANEREAVKFVLALHEKDTASISEHL
jgi:hypothetical protein